MLKMHTIQQGERLSLWPKEGRIRFVDGPRRLWTLCERAEPMKRHAVELGQYPVAIIQSPDRLVRIEGGAATQQLHLYPDGIPTHE